MKYYLIAYDIGIQKYRRLLLKMITPFGIALQYSAYIIYIGKNDFERLVKEIKTFYKKYAAVSKRKGSSFCIEIIPICGDCYRKSIGLGCKLYDFCENYVA